MKRRIFIILFIFSVISVRFIKTSAINTTCSFIKTYTDLSTENFQSKIDEINYSDIVKICTDNICTYRYDNDLDLFIRLHKNKVLDNINNFDKKTVYSLKGVRISKMYFSSCI